MNKLKPNNNKLLEDLLNREDAYDTKEERGGFDQK